jgi:hypothetical protein
MAEQQGEGHGSLPDQHLQPIHHRKSQGSSLRQKTGLERRIDDVIDKGAGRKAGQVHLQGGLSFHAQTSRIDQEIRALDPHPGP